MALGHFGLSQGTAAAAATTREENNAAARFTAIRALIGTGDPPLTEAQAAAEVDRHLPAPPTAQAAPEGYRPTLRERGDMFILAHPRPPDINAVATPGTLPAPPTAQAPPAPAPLTPAQIEGIRQMNLVAGRDAAIRGEPGAPPVPGVPNWITDPKTGKLVMVPGQPLANIPIFERTVEQLNGQLPLPTAPTQDLAPPTAAPHPYQTLQGFPVGTQPLSNPILQKQLAISGQARGPQPQPRTLPAAPPQAPAPPTAAPQATPGTLPPLPQETLTPLERAAQSKREKGNLPKQDAALAKDLEKFKDKISGEFPEKEDEGYEQYMKAKKRYDAVHSKYLKSIGLPEEPAEDAASTQTLTAPPASVQQARDSLKKARPDLTDAQIDAVLKKAGKL